MRQTRSATRRVNDKPRLAPTAGVLVTRSRPPTVVQTARVTVLFADLRGYTGMAEKLPAARVLPLLEEFFKVLAGATALHGGEVFHMAGDGIMAGFGVSEAGSDGAYDAVTAGHAILKGFEPIAQRWRSDLSIDSGIGVGLHLGEVAVGMLGPPGRKTTTLVGDTVNVAARLCSRARAGEVLFSCTVADALSGTSSAVDHHSRAIPFLQLPQYALRGRREPIDIWCIPAQKRLAL